MNKAYKLIWSKKKGIKIATCWSGSPFIGALVLSAMLSFGGTAKALDPNTLPKGGTVVSGNAVISQSSNRMTINQSTDRIITNWNTFNIGKDASVNFKQPGSSSVALNRILDRNPSQIFGNLSANGQIYLLNPSGIIFGSTARIDVGSLVASSLNITNENFLAGKRIFEKVDTAGAITNYGTIKTASGGYIAFLSPKITNEGTIAALNGAVALAAGDKVSLDFAGDKLITFTVDKGAVDAQIDNKGLVKAENGMVMMTAKTADALINSVVNNTGMIEAKGIVAKGGRIVLDGDEVINSGTLDVSARASFPAGGGAGDGVSPTGGTIKLLGKKVSVTGNAVLDASGDAGGGEILIGGNYQGKGPEANAKETYIGENVKIYADAIANGNGGRVIVWADDKTTVNGSISARGGVLGGNGGFVETSGHTLKVGDTAFVDTRGPKGKTGLWLLDPYDFTIAASGGDMTGATLGTALGSGDVTIQTSADSAGCTGASCGTGNASGNGDIFVNDTVSWATANRLTLSAYRNIEINSAITASGGGNLSLLYGQGSDDGVIDGTTAVYKISAPVNLIAAAEGARRFTTQLGSAGGEVSYTVITDLGEAGDEGTGASTLQGIAKAANLSGNYALGANIDASGTSGWNSDAGFVPIGDDSGDEGSTRFTGQFDGLGHTISGLTINRPASEYVGLFGYIQGTVKNTGITGGSVKGSNYVGGLAGYNNFGTITNSYSTGTVTSTGNSVGGLAGYNDSGTITNSYSTGTVTSTGDSVGGLVGGNAGTITNSRYEGTGVTGQYYVGGLAGVNYSTITNSFYNMHTVAIKAKGDDNPTTDTVITTGGLYDNMYTVWKNNSYNTMNPDGYFNTSSGYYLVNNSNIRNLLGFADQSSLKFRLEENIALSSNFYIPYFAGAEFDGAGKTVSGLKLDRSDMSFMGFVGYVKSGATIKNLHLTDVNVSGYRYVGGLVGYNYGTITSSYATGAVAGNATLGGLAGWNDGTINSSYATNTVTLQGTGDNSNIGGLVGEQSSNGTITDSYATGAVSGADATYVGGLIGVNYLGTITKSYATGAVTVNTYGGGLAGRNDGNITKSYATGAVTGSGGSVGGLVGYVVQGTITSSYATGAVTAANQVGGLVGLNMGSGTITKSYATGAVTKLGGNRIGGLAGENAGTITNSFWDTNTTGQASGYDGANAAFNSTYGKTTADMKKYTSFSSWGTDITNTSGSSTAVWRIYEGQTYPLLENFLTALTLTAGDSKTYNGLAYSGGAYSGSAAYDAAKILGAAVYGGAAQGAKNTGSYALTLDGSGLYSNQQGYDLSFSNGTLVINPKAISATGITVGNKTYDRSTAATMNTGGAGLSGIESGDEAVTLNVASATGAFANWNVGTGKTVTVSGLALNNNALGNYTLNGYTTTANITAKSLTASYTGTNKTYDGTTSATVTGSLAGIITGDTVNFSQTAAFADKSAGTGKTVNVASIAISGNDAGNYALSSTTATATADITKVNLTVTANDDDKTYTGNPYSGGNGVGYSGFVNNETSSVLGGTLEYGGTSQGAVNAGTYGINPSGLTSNNYSLSYVNGTLTITGSPSNGGGEARNAVDSVTAAITSAQNSANSTAEQDQSGLGTRTAPTVITPGAGSSAITNAINSTLVTTPAGGGSPTTIQASTGGVDSTTGSAMTTASGMGATTGGIGTYSGTGSTPSTDPTATQQPLFPQGGSVILSSNTSSTPVTITSSGDTVSMTIGGLQTADNAPAQSSALTVFMQQGNSPPILQGNFIVRESGNTVSMTPTTNTEAQMAPPQTGATLVASIPFTLTTEKGTQIQLNASVSKDGVLTVTAPGSAGSFDIKQAVLMGTRIARQELHVEIGVLKSALFVRQ